MENHYFYQAEIHELLREHILQKNLFSIIASSPWRLDISMGEIVIFDIYNKKQVVFKLLFSHQETKTKSSFISTNAKIVCYFQYFLLICSFSLLHSHIFKLVYLYKFTLNKIGEWKKREGGGGKILDDTAVFLSSCRGYVLEEKFWVNFAQRFKNLSLGQKFCGSVPGWVVRSSLKFYK